jgi:hypothetical protein
MSENDLWGWWFACVAAMMVLATICAGACLAVVTIRFCMMLYDVLEEWGSQWLDRLRAWRRDIPTPKLGETGADPAEYSLPKREYSDGSWEYIDQ